MPPAQPKPQPASKPPSPAVVAFIVIFIVLALAAAVFVSYMQFRAVNTALETGHGGVAGMLVAEGIAAEVL